MEIIATSLLILATSFTGVASDYACICNDEIYSVEVYQETKNSSTVIGHIDHSKCKQEICDQGDSSWIKVEYETQFGYVDKTSWIVRRVCTGNSPAKTATPCDISTKHTTTPLSSSTDTDAITVTPSTTGKQSHTVTTTTFPSTMTLTSTTASHPNQVASALPDGNVNLCTQSMRGAAAYYHVTLGQHGNMCYTIDTTHQMAWHHAEETCVSHGGHLVNIQNEDQQRFIAQFVALHSPSEPVWIGLHDTYKEGVYMWSNNGYLSYNHWAPNHVNIFTQHVDDCVVMKPDGFWDDITCGSKTLFRGDKGQVHPFICQFDINSEGFPGIFG